MTTQAKAALDIAIQASRERREAAQELAKLVIAGEGSSAAAQKLAERVYDPLADPTSEQGRRRQRNRPKATRAS